jgi:hypothetical protein
MQSGSQKPVFLPNFLGIKPRPSRTAFILLELCYGFYIQFNNVNAGI